MHDVKKDENNFLSAIPLVLARPFLVLPTELCISRAMFIGTFFLLFLFPNEPPNANGITTHPRSHDSFYIHDEMLVYSKARELNVRFSYSRHPKSVPIVFQEILAQGVKL